MTPPRFVAVLCAAAALTACSGHRGRTALEECLEAPQSYGEGTTRRGGWSEQLGFEWDDWNGRRGVYASPDQRLLGSESIVHCEHFVTVEQAGRAWKSRGYARVDHFVTDRLGRRWAFEGWNEHAVVIVDGAESPALREVLWMPTFSANGAHVAYLAKDKGGAIVVVDGGVAMRARDIKPNNFVLLDDGRFAVVRSAAAPGQWEVAFDRWVSPSFDDVFELSFAVHEKKGRLGFVGVRAGKYTAVIDGKEIPAPGVPLNHELRFSDDGEHFAYTTIVRNRPETSDDDQNFVVWDGRVIPIQGIGLLARFLGPRPIVSTSGPAFSDETHYVVVGLPTPPVPASEDDYRPAGGSHWASRVRIGDSLGPRFDELESNSLELGADGRVRYFGLRAGSRIEVIDNRLPGDAPKPRAQVAQ